jgi:osmotically-inducible protein OsmY
MTTRLACTGVWLSLTAFAAAPAIALQQTPPDNTKVNARDRAASQVTADQQKNNRSDVDITRDIRQALVKNKNLSTYAHNVKVITENGNVTLKGPVRSEHEKKTVETTAIDIAGAEHVKSEIAVAHKPAKHPAAK